MRHGTTRRDTRKTDPELARARKRAAFIAALRRGSSVTMPAVPASTQIIEAEVASRKVQPPPVATKPPPVATRPPPVATKPQPQPQPSPVAAKPAPVATRPQPPVVANPQPPVPASPPVPVAATPAPPARAAQPSPKLFREQALKHRLAAEEGRGLVRVSPPWTWAILWCVVAGLGAAIVASAVGQVEVTSRGRGVLRPAAGVLALTSQMTGTVARVERRSGERVEAGDTLLVIDSPAAQAQLLEADRQLDAVRTQFAGVATQQDRHYAEQIDSLRARAKRAEEQIDSLRSSVVRQQQRLQADEQLLAKGLMSRLAVAETRESLAQAQRQLSGAQQSLDQSRQELASMEARRQDELWQRKQMLDAAQTKRDSLAVVLQQREVKASHAGVVEAMTVKVGEAVQAGQILGKIVPTESPLQVVSFLAEKDRAFAKPGDEVRLELDQLPHAEYGTLRAKVVRIGDDLASPQEMREALGEDQKILEMPPSYRVELQITDSGPADAAHVKLRTGTLMNVRYTLRRQKLITMVFTPLKRWFR